MLSNSKTVFKNETCMQQVRNVTETALTLFFQASNICDKISPKPFLQIEMSMHMVDEGVDEKAWKICGC